VFPFEFTSPANDCGTVGFASQNCSGCEAHGIGKKELKRKKYLDQPPQRASILKAARG
jgi:hypothetical protein